MRALVAGGVTHSYAQQYLTRAIAYASRLDAAKIEALVDRLVAVQTAVGRLIILGLGGSAATASHLAADLRRQTGLRAESPTDAMCEVLAAANDRCWDECFRPALHHLSEVDALLVLSGSGESAPLVNAMHYARGRRVPILALLGGAGGVAASLANVAMLVPTDPGDDFYPQTEGLHSVIAHLIAFHPKLRAPRW